MRYFLAGGIPDECQSCAGSSLAMKLIEVVLCDTSRSHHSDDMGPIPQCSDRLSMAGRWNTLINRSMSRIFDANIARVGIRSCTIHRNRLHRCRHSLRMDPDIPTIKPINAEKCRSLYTIPPLPSRLSIRLLLSRRFHRN